MNEIEEQTKQKRAREETSASQPTRPQGRPRAPAQLTHGRRGATSPALRIRAAIGISFFVAGGCASRDESLGCAELVVTCPGAAAEQQWWLTKKPSSSQWLQIQGGQDCGAWLAFIQDGATARYDDIDLGVREGEMRLRVVVAAADAETPGGTLTLFADSDLTTPVTSCVIGRTGGWFNWLVVDCGPLPLRGLHSLTFKFNGTTQYAFNFAAFGVVRSGSPDCTVTGPKRD